MLRLAALVSALVFASLAGAQGAPATTFVSNFETSREGWGVFDFHDDPWTFATPARFATGGNPGGFIRFTDPETPFCQGISDPPGCDWNTDAFSSYPGSEWSGDASANYGGTLSFDLRGGQHGGSGNVGSGVFLWSGDPTDQQSVSYVAVSFVQNTASTDWQHFSFPVTKAGFPGGSGGQPSTQASVRAILADLGGVWINSDDEESAGETSDLDNVRMTEGPPPGDVARSLTARYSNPTGAFTGRLSNVERFDPQACVADELVRVFQKQPGPDDLVGLDRTSNDGVYSLVHPRNPSRTYYALAPRSSIPGGACLQARSPDLPASG